MNITYAPQEKEKVVMGTFTFAPRQLRWLRDMNEATGYSKAHILRTVIDAAIRGEVAEIAPPSIAEEREQVPA